MVGQPQVIQNAHAIMELNFRIARDPGAIQKIRFHKPNSHY
jgi:hypothetical protein